MDSISDISRMQYQNSRITPPTAKNNSDAVQLKEACDDFSAILIKQMLSAMKKTVSKSGLIDGGMAEEVFDDMLYDEYSKMMAKTANFGISEMMFNQLKGTL